MKAEFLKHLLRKNSRFQFYLLVLSFLLFSIFRSPEITLHGRFFSEEGSYFWAHALQVPWSQELFYVGFGTGYFLLNANVSTALASHTSLMIQPLISTWISIFFMFLPGALLFRYLPKSIGVKRIHISLIFLFALPVLNEDVFANSISSQVFLGLTTFAIAVVFPRVEGTRTRFSLIFLILLGSLNGWYSIALLPLFLLNYLRFRNKHNFLPIMVLLSGLITQALVLIISVMNSSVFSDRLSMDVGPSKLLADFKEIVRLSFEGDVGYSKKWLLVSLGVVFILILFSRRFTLSSMETTDRPEFKFFLAQTLIAFFLEYSLILFGQVGSAMWGRYTVIPGTLFLLSLYLLAVLIEMGTRLRLLSFSLISFIILLGLSTVLHGKLDYLVCKRPCISWNQQVSESLNGTRLFVIHWPFGRGYSTNMHDPRPRLQD